MFDLQKDPDRGVQGVGHHDFSETWVTTGMKMGKSIDNADLCAGCPGK
jgi:hypothetical protein